VSGGEVPVRELVTTYISSFDNSLGVSEKVNDSRIPGGKWVFFAKGGGYSPYFLPIHLVVNWASNGAEIKARLNPKSGKPYSNVWQLAGTERNFFFKAGISWPRRAYGRLSFRVIPKGCVFGDSAPTLFIDDKNQLFTLLIVGNSRLFEKLLSVWSARGTEDTSGQTMKMEVGSLLDTPLPNGSVPEHYRDIVEKMFHLIQTAGSSEEISTLFLPVMKSEKCQEVSTEVEEFLIETERVVSEIYELTPLDCDVHGDTYNEFSDNKRDGPTEEPLCETDADDEDEKKPETQDAVNSSKDLLSLMFGFTFGRWDARIAMNQSLAPKLPELFEPLPGCPPAMLIGPDGLPAKPGGIVSEEWLRTRSNAITLPPEGSVSRPTIPDEEYPLRISWSGILVDDSDGEETQAHPEDIVHRLREVLDLLWGERAQTIEQEACEILGVASLRDYFRKPSGFFDDHLKRYSKSRRKAPIYWPLSTESGSYTLWIYYHRLTDQTLYQCVNDFVDPKLETVAQDVDKLRGQVLQGGTAKQRDHLERLQRLQQELTDFRAELLRVAALPYRPNLNDGVLITASPLYKLFRLPRWRKDLQECWKKLESGEYDWAHLAYSIWPERVKEKCRTDRSIAIAHDLEELFQEPKIQKKPKKAKTRG